MGKRGRLIVLASAVGAVLVLVLLAVPIYELVLEAWFLRKLDSSDMAVQLDAVERLGELGSVRAIPALLEMTARPSGSVSSTKHDGADPVFKALEMIVAKKGLPAVRRIIPDLDGPSPRARLIAAHLLARAGTAAAPILPDLLGALRKHCGPEPEIQEPLMQAIAGVGAPAVPALGELLHGPKESLAYLAACCLGRVGVMAMPVIRGALDDPSTSVRWLALHALLALGPEGRLAAPRVRELLLDPDIAVREHARSVLAGMKLDPGR